MPSYGSELLGTTCAWATDERDRRMDSSVLLRERPYHRILHNCQQQYVATVTTSQMRSRAGYQRLPPDVDTSQVSASCAVDSRRMDNISYSYAACYVTLLHAGAFAEERVPSLPVHGHAPVAGHTPETRPDERLGVATSHKAANMSIILRQGQWVSLPSPLRRRMIRASACLRRRCQRVPWPWPSSCASSASSP